MAAEAIPDLIEVDPDEIVDAYATRGWGDGLPLVPPTVERVAAMLDTLGEVDADETIAVLAPRDGAATRRIIAVNAVLAGCLPPHLPVVISAVRALGDPSLNLRGVNATTHPVAPLLVVHGQAALDGGYNAGVGAFGPGNRANAVTGRAVRLVLMHVAGATPGPGDASTQGGPAKYTYCVAENIAESPWGGYAASRGVDAPSAVTVHCGEAPHNVHDMENATPA
ncbi:MAG TPA: thioredoxin, partial [Ilumatobacteraceae bacterium]|nr:thioredoxin [Ilumatobacteraceae bacterium]